MDLFVEDLSFEKFSAFWEIVSGEFGCLNASNPKNGYALLKEGTALRFHKKDSFVPNIEFKPLKTVLDRYSLENRVEVECSGKRIFLSPLELQIAYKLELGSEKDLEDARFLYKLLKEHLNTPLLKKMLERLRISEAKFVRAIGEDLGENDG